MIQHQIKLTGGKDEEPHISSGWVVRVGEDENIFEVEVLSSSSSLRGKEKFRRSSTSTPTNSSVTIFLYPKFSISIYQTHKSSRKIENKGFVGI